jgi:hypothetical protein
LQELEGPPKETVTLEAGAKGAVKARWNEGVVPRMRSFTVSEPKAPTALPSLPAELTPLPVTFLKVLDQARRCTARDSTRYALAKLQFRGASGEVVATDGRQLLIQSGFALPWDEDVLVPALAVFGNRELAHADPVRMGKTATHVCVQAGPWTFFLAIDRDGRYPRVNDVIPRPDKAATHCQLMPSDAAFLARTLFRMVDTKDEDQAVTLDLNSRVVVRARPGDQERSTEVVLEHSTVTGPAVRVATNAR